jgi:hypothetical protein
MSANETDSGIKKMGKLCPQELPAIEGISG